MIRIISGVAYQVKSASTFTVRAHEMNGHLEVSAVRDKVMEELEWSPSQIQDHLDMVAAAYEDEEFLQERQAKLLKIAANRAKTRVRRLCKAMGADTLLTLTYRFNEQDLAQVKRDLKEFNRRMLRVMPSFRFVAAFEQQKRGAWHVHMATAGIPSAFVQKNANGLPVRVKSFYVIRSIWLSVTKGRQGNIDLQKRKHHNQSSPAAIAAYISKYIAKNFEQGAKGSNRFAAYGDFTLPPVVVLGRVSSALEAVEVAYSCCGGRVVFDQHYSRFGDWFFLHAEMPAKNSASPPLALH